MELTDAERECRNDAADHEAERWKVHNWRGSGIRIDYAQDSDNTYGDGGPYIEVSGSGSIYEFQSPEYLDALIDALTTAREFVFGLKEES